METKSEHNANQPASTEAVYAEVKDEHIAESGRIIRIISRQRLDPKLAALTQTPAPFSFKSQDKRQLKGVSLRKSCATEAEYIERKRVLAKLRYQQNKEHIREQSRASYLKQKQQGCTKNGGLPKSVQLKMRYATDEEFANRKRAYMRKKYQEDPFYAQKKREEARMRYFSKKNQPLEHQEAPVHYVLTPVTQEGPSTLEQTNAAQAKEEKEMNEMYNRAGSESETECIFMKSEDVCEKCQRQTCVCGEGVDAQEHNTTAAGNSQAFPTALQQLVSAGQSSGQTEIEVHIQAQDPDQTQTVMAEYVADTDEIDETSDSVYYLCPVDGCQCVFPTMEVLQIHFKHHHPALSIETQE